MTTEIEEIYNYIDVLKSGEPIDYEEFREVLQNYDSPGDNDSHRYSNKVVECLLDASFPEYDVHDYMGNFVLNFCTGVLAFITCDCIIEIFFGYYNIKIPKYKELLIDAAVGIVFCKYAGYFLEAEIELVIFKEEVSECMGDIGIDNISTDL